MEIEEIARGVVDCGYRLHTELGPGLLESDYEVVLAKLLTDCGFCLERQKPVPIIFSGLRFDEGFRADLLVEGKLLVEIKSVENLAPVHGKQLLTYLRAPQPASWSAHELRSCYFQERHQTDCQQSFRLRGFAASRAPRSPRGCA